MNVKQKLSILFYPKRKKADKNGQIPIYIRITIDGEEDEISLGRKVLSQDWDMEGKKVLNTDPDYQETNKRIENARVDIGRHFDLEQAKKEIATAAMVKASYMTPLNGQQRANEKIENLRLSEATDALIKRFVIYSEKYRKAHDKKDAPAPEKTYLLDLEKKGIGQDMEKLVKAGNLVFDRPTHQKTLVLTITEYLIGYLQLAFTGNRAYTSLEKWLCRKRRFIEFMQYRYKRDDIPLADMKYTFLEEFNTYLLVQHKLKANTASKFIQNLKEFFERAVAKGWTERNPYSIYKCKYIDPDHDWPEMSEFLRLKDWTFETPRLTESRDIFVVGCLTGYSYQELYSLRAEDLKNGMDGKLWAGKDRQKTGVEETLPLLPLALQVIDIYKSHPMCQRTGRLLPMPTIQTYNKNLKEIGRATGINIVMRSHKCRFFFANVIAYENGVQLKTIAGLLGQKGMGSVNIYVRKNKKLISESMEMVEEKMQSKYGDLTKPTGQGGGKVTDQEYPELPMVAERGARIIQMRRF